MLRLAGIDLRHWRITPEIIVRCLITSIFAGVTQLSLLIIPNFFGSFSLLPQLLLSVIVFVLVIGFGQCCRRRLLRVRASAPVFVLFHLMFIWMFYVVVIRYAVSPLMNIILNGGLVILLIAFIRMLASDPGFVHHDTSSSLENSFSEFGAQDEELTSFASNISPSNELNSLSSGRVRYCRNCKAFVRGFDHHCPAFGNCIGQKNYVLFMVLLVGFVIVEASYAICSYQWVKRFHNSNVSSMEIYVTESLAVSTMLFCLLQVFWQVVFLTWHIYCVCVNIRTDEWINWRRYPEFHVISQLSPGQSEVSYRNPYDKGIFHNLKDLFTQDDKIADQV